MSENRYTRICAPATVADHQLSDFKGYFAAAFAAGTRKAGAVIEKINVDQSHGERVFAVKIRGTMNPTQAQVVQQYSL